MKYILSKAKKMAWFIMGGLAIKVVATLAELALPYILSHIIDDIVPLESVKLIVYWGIAMIFCSVLALWGNIIANRMSVKTARDIIYDVRHDLFEKTMNLSSAQIDRFTIPSLESRLTSDTYHVYHFIGMILRIGVRAPILLFGGLILTVSLDWVLTLVMMMVIPIIFVIVLYIRIKGVPLYTAVQERADKMVRVVREDSQGMRVIKALSKADYESRRFDTENKELVKAEKKAELTMAISSPFMNLCLNLGIAAVILVGAFRVDSGLTQPGKIIAFMQYFTLFANAIMAVTRIFMMYTKGAASASRIAEVVHSDTDLCIKTESEYPSIKSDDFIRFKNVHFSYNKTKNNLSDIDFSLKKGQTLGIIGATGSGKSTLAYLLMRFYDVDKGGIYINGRDIRTIPSDELRALFGIVMQNGFIYAETIEENIRFGRDIDIEDIKSASKVAQASEFIDNFEDGYEHMITSNGTNISGGQKQRLMIARALAAKPQILILDDSSSALDYKTDANLRMALRSYTEDMTVIIIAQRISSVMSADNILVLDEGKIIGNGTHTQLMDTCYVYREISSSQMGGAFLE